jgi:hypothetical protein
MMVARLRACAAAVGLMIALVPRGALAYPFEDLVSDPNKDWVESKPDLPAPPEDKNLLPFYVSPSTSFRFLIDRPSLSIGSDQVVRYTLVAISSSGARNVRYEGMRCATHEFKVYAIQSPDGKWQEARPSRWKRIVEAAANREESALAKDAICDNGLAVATDQIVLRLNPDSMDRVRQ